MLMLVLFSWSCSEEETRPESSSQLVVEGWIEDGQFPIVILTSSVPVTQTYQNVDSLDQYVIKWAKVTISDETNSVVLMGKVDKKYFPPYVYTTSYLRGKAGHKYKLTVSCEDMYAEAETTIPQPVEVNSLNVIKVPDSIASYKVVANFSDNPFEKNYYKFFVEVYNKEKRFLSSPMGLVDDACLNINSEVLIQPGKRIDGINEYSPYFSVNDTVLVKITQVDPVSYEIWKGFEELSSLSRNPIYMWHENIKTNISGGLGYWCGYGSSISSVVIK